MLIFALLLMLPNLIYGNITASEGTFDDKIIVEWNAVSNAAHYRIDRVFDSPYTTVKGKNIPIESVLLGETDKLSFTDMPAPPGRHKYIVTALDKDGEELSSEEGFGWRKITDQEFFFEFQKGIDSSLPRIRTLKSLNFFGEKKPGWKNGSLVYKTSGIFRRPIRITITYTNFTDQYLSLNGTYEIQIFKIIGQKGKLVGTINVDGIYKGSVTHDLVLDRGKSTNGGVYRVQQEGRPEIVLPWNVTPHPLDDSQYEKNLKGTIGEMKDDDEDNE
ncbi:MAG: hypothetical protein ACRC9L_00540 [Brevinema sp.]